MHRLHRWSVPLGLVAVPCLGFVLAAWGGDTPARPDRGGDPSGVEIDPDEAPRLLLDWEARELNEGDIVGGLMPVPAEGEREVLLEDEPAPAAVDGPLQTAPVELPDLLQPADDLPPAIAPDAEGDAAPPAPESSDPEPAPHAVEPALPRVLRPGIGARSPDVPDENLSRGLLALRARVRKTLGSYYNRRLNTDQHNPWEMMHAIIAYGVYSKVHHGGPRDESVNAVSWVCGNGLCGMDRLLYLEDDRIAARKGHRVQGHYGQFMAILAQSRVPADYTLRVDGQYFTLQDLIETEKLGCEEGMELTFKLIGLTHYLPLDAEWENHQGETWSIERLLEEELKAPLRGAACGGTHRLTGIAYAVQKRRRADLPLSGVFGRAERYLSENHALALSLQNSDGSLSTEWFNRRGNRDDLDRRLQTTGHILEWLVYSLPSRQLDDPKVVKAVNYVCSILLKYPRREWEIGPLGHALHALAIYDDRLFKLDVQETPVEEEVVRRPAGSARREPDSEPAPERQ